MPFRIKISLYVLLFLAVLFLVVPLVVPVPPAPNTRPLAELAGDAQYVTAAGVNLRVQSYPATAPENENTWFVLLHDYAFSAYTFETLAPQLTHLGNVVAFDRPGFGLSERPMPEGGRYDIGFDPYTADAQTLLTLALMDQLGATEAVLVGNGMGGRVALDAALAQPESVIGLVLIDTPVYLQDGRAAPGWFLSSPQMKRLGPVFLRQLGEGPGEQLLLNAFVNQSVVTDEIRAKHAVTTSVENWDRALWEISRIGQPNDLTGRLPAITAPTLLVTGEGLPPTARVEAERLSQDLRTADLVGLPNCGRVPQLECPEALLDAIEHWWAGAAPASRR